MTGLVEWLRSQLDADEAIARRAIPGPWQWVTSVARHHRNALIGPGWPYQTVLLAAEMPLSVMDAKHIATNDPAHVMRTVAAHRAILDEHAEGRFGLPGAFERNCIRCVTVAAPCTTVRRLASIYAARAGFDPAWKVEP